MKYHVLVVDDETEILELAQTFLMLKGFAVTTCPNAEAGLEFLRSHTVDAVLSDLTLPGIDGMDFYLRLKKTLPMMPTFVFISANTAKRPEFEMAQREGNPFKVFYKPFSFGVIAEYLAGEIAKVKSVH